ncbi:MAG: NAD(P)-dependent oxidoreductase [Gammaproteobacteria bacterium]|nr:NAD(P)-dependent oxidoreductase [Gammaproteobacteria bacterium]
MKKACIQRTRIDCLNVLNNREKALLALKNTELAVIGGTGFVGTWIAEMVAALNDDYQFRIKLSLISRSANQFSARLPHLASRGDIDLVAADVRQLGQFPMGAEWVIHAAATPDVRTHASKPLDTASTIVDGTMSVMRIAERLGQLKKLLYLSSGLVCGPQSGSQNGLAENASGSWPPEASFVYQNAKRFSETVCSAARVQSRIPVSVARPFSFIGPYQSLDTPWAQTTFLADALRGKSIRVLGDGQVKRSYLYGSDVAFWLLKLVTAGETGDVINVGSSEGITLQELARLTAKNFSPTPDVIFNVSPRKSARMEYFFPDTTYARTKFGLSVMTPIEEAVRLTTQWHILQHG